jgi:hypothetical protein
MGFSEASNQLFAQTIAAILAVLRQMCKKHRHLKQNMSQFMHRWTVAKSRKRYNDQSQ